MAQICCAGDCLRATVVIVVPNKRKTTSPVGRGSSVVECRTRNQVSPGSNPLLGIFLLSIDAPVDSAV